MKQEIDIKLINPNKWNPNRMSEDEYKTLKISIKVTKGQRLEDNPILVRPIKKRFEIINGEHRWKAAKELGHKKIWCEVQEMDDDNAFELCIILNKDRGNLGYFLLSKGLNKRWERYQHSNENKEQEKANQKELGERLGYDQPKISQILPIYPRLAELAEKYITLYTFNNSTLLQIARIRDDGLRELLVSAMQEKNIAVATLQKIATNLNQAVDYIAEKTSDEDLQGNILASLIELGEIILDYNLQAIKGEIDLLYETEQSKRMIHGNMFEIIPELDIEFDCICTDPPYGLSYDNLVKLPGRKDFKRDKGDWDHFTEKEYLQFTNDWLDVALPKLKDGGAILIFTSDYYVSHIIDILQEKGLKKRNTIVWRKTNPPPIAVQTNWVSSSEFIVYATKGKQKTFNWFGQNEMHNVIPCSVLSGKNLGHPAQKPAELVSRILKSVTNVGDMVLDPFAGTGTTAVACEELERGWLMIEQNEKYYKVMERRLKE